MVIMKINIKIVQGKSEMSIESNDTQEILDKLEDIQKIQDKIASMYLVNVPTTISGDVATSIEVSGTAPSELIAKCKPKNISDKIMLMVYYLWKKSVLSVNAKDMKKVFEEILEPQPQNWGAMMNNLVTKGLMAKAQQKDNVRTWSITRTGLDYVEKELLKNKEASK